jgi:hypothetical protein
MNRKWIHCPGSLRPLRQLPSEFFDVQIEIEIASNAGLIDYGSSEPKRIRNLEGRLEGIRQKRPKHEEKLFPACGLGRLRLRGEPHGIHPYRPSEIR